MSGGLFARDLFSGESLGQVDPSFPPGCGSGGPCDWASYCAANPTATYAACTPYRTPSPGISPLLLSKTMTLTPTLKVMAPTLAPPIQSTPPAIDPNALPPPDITPFGVPPGTGPGAPAPAPSNFNLFASPLFFWGAIGGGVLLVGTAGYFMLRHKPKPNRRRRSRR